MAGGINVGLKKNARDFYGKPVVRVTVVATSRFYSLDPKEARALAAELTAMADTAELTEPEDK